MPATEACRACESVRRGAQRARQRAAAAGARTSSAAEERARLPLRAAFQNGEAGGMLMKWARAVRL